MYSTDGYPQAQNTLGGYAQTGQAVGPAPETASMVLLRQLEQILAHAGAIDTRMGALADRACGPTPQAAGTGTEKGFGGGGFAHQVETRLSAIASAVQRMDDSVQRLERFV